MKIHRLIMEHVKVSLAKGFYIHKKPIFRNIGLRDMLRDK